MNSLNHYAYGAVAEWMYRDVAGIAPEALLALDPCFETESGGMVLVTVRVAGLDPALAERMSGHRGRQEALGALAEGLRKRCPGLSVRCVGGELLLAPVREGKAV